VAKIAAKSQHEITVPKTITKSIKLNIWHWWPSLHVVHCKVFICKKFCHCGALKYNFLWRRYGHIESQ